MLIDKNLYDLCEYFIKLQYPITITQISKDLNISRKIIYYNIDKINNILKKSNIENIKNIKGKGVLLTKIQKNIVQNFVNKNNKIYILKPSERILLILLMISCWEKKLIIKDFENSILVSKNTVISDIHLAKEYLKNNDYSLIIKNDKILGYYLKGYNFEIIQFLYSLLEEIYSQKNENYINYIKNIFINEFKNDIYYNNDFTNFLVYTVEKNINKLGKTIKEKDLKQLLEFFPYISLSYKKSEIISSPLDIKKINDTLSPVKERLEYQISLDIFNSLYKEFKLKYKQEEALLFALLLLCVKKDDDKHNYSNDYKNLRNTLNNFILIFENYSNLNLINKEKLIYGLTTHFKALIFRKKYSIISKNYYANEIKNEYPFIFECVKKSCKYLEEKLQIKLIDGDISYISTHFLAILEDEKDLNKINLAIITDESSTIIELLKNQIKNRFSNFNILKTINLSKIDKTNFDDCQYILSTISGLNIKNKNIIYINSILNNNDIINLRKLSKIEDINYNKFKIHLKNIVYSEDKNDEKFKNIIQIIENELFLN